MTTAVEKEACPVASGLASNKWTDKSTNAACLVARDDGDLGDGG